MSRFAVTGAYGWIGQTLCQWLESQRHTVVRVSSRARGNAALVWNAPEPLTSELRSMLAQVDAVIHCAAHVHHSTETAAEAERFFDVNTRGTERLVRACEASGSPRMVLVSTIAVYGAGSEPQCEDAPIECSTAYAKSKWEAEECVKSSSLDWRVGRLATVFGAGDPANFQKLAKAIAKKRFVIPGHGSARKSVLPVNRAAELLGRLAILERPQHRTVNLASPSVPDVREIASAFCRLCNFPAPRSVPLSILRLLAMAGNLAALVRQDFPFTSANLRKLTTSTVVSTDRQQELFPDIVWGDFEAELRPHAPYYQDMIRK